jgi:hypothetical protein
MSNLWTAQIRVDDLLTERLYEADVERLTHLGDKPSPALAAWLASALRSAADLLDAAPQERRPGSLSQG